MHQPKTRAVTHPNFELPNITLGCGTGITLEALDAAKISYVPCGTVDGKDQPLLKFAHLHGQKRHSGKAAYGKKWNAYTTSSMTGVQLMCGMPTNRRHGRTGYLYYNSIDIETRLLTEYPDVAEQIQTIYRSNCKGTPCEIQTKSGGLRLDAYTEYVGGKWAFKDNGGMLLEVLANKCLARIDHRYSILSGSILDMPTLPKKALQEIHGIISEIATTETTGDDKEREVVERSQIGDLNIEWDSDNRSQLFPTLHCQKTDHRSNRDEVRFTKHSDGSVDGKCFNCGEIWWEIPPPTGKRYTTDLSFEHKTSDIDTQRAENKNAVVQWLQETKNKKGKHLLILGSAAGTAKTTVGIFTPDGLLYIANTTEEADNVFRSLDDAEEDVYRHRSRMFNRGHTDIDGNNDWHTLPIGLGNHERPCSEPETCDLLAARGHAPTEFCTTQCPNYENCIEKGFLSQADKEKNASKVVYAWGEDIAVDTNLAKLIKRICAKGDILVVDEVNPLNLTQLRKLNRDILFDLRERFRHPGVRTTEVFEKIKALLNIISTAETPETFINDVKAWIDGIDDIEALDEKIKRYPIGCIFEKTPIGAVHNRPFEATLIYQDKEVKVPVVDFETAADTPTLFINPDTPIQTEKYHVKFVSFGFLRKVELATFSDPPRRHRNFLTDLKTFFDENRNIETAPFTFDPKEQTFEFHIKPTLNHRRAIFNTASDPDNLISEAYRDTPVNITHHTGTPPPWKTDLVFQLSTGNYLPRQSLIRQEGTDENRTLHLKPRAQEFVDAFILPTIKAGLKTLVVAPKAFQKVESVIGDEKSNSGWAVTHIDNIIEGRTAMLINHHHAEGRNDFQDYDIAFVFHYEPNHHEIIAASKRLYQNPETPLSFEREERTITIGGVNFKKNAYIDDRVQAVYNRECRARLMQSGMRLRPNINEAKIIVFLTAEPIDIPVTPVPFSPKDAKHFTGDWTEFKARLQGTVKEKIANGKSKSKVYRDTEAQRKQEKTDRDAKIIQLHDKGLKPKEISIQLKKTGYTTGTDTRSIQRFIKKRQNSHSTINRSL